MYDIQKFKKTYLVKENNRESECHRENQNTERQEKEKKGEGNEEWVRENRK